MNSYREKLVDKIIKQNILFEDNFDDFLLKILQKLIL